MTDPRNRRDPLEALFDPRTWARFEKQLTGGIEKAIRGISLKKDAVETEAGLKTYLVATLDIPGVPKENVKVEFTELDYGFTRLSITTKRGEDENLFKVEFRESVVAEGATATADLGVLTVRVPLKEDDTRTKFDVPVA